MRGGANPVRWKLYVQPAGTVGDMSTGIEGGADMLVTLSVITRCGQGEVVSLPGTLYSKNEDKQKTARA